MRWEEYFAALMGIGITPEIYSRMTVHQVLGLSKGIEIQGIKAEYNAEEGISMSGSGVKYVKTTVKK